MFYPLPRALKFGELSDTEILQIDRILPKIKSDDTIELIADHPYPVGHIRPLCHENEKIALLNESMETSKAHAAKREEVTIPNSNQKRYLTCPVNAKSNTRYISEVDLKRHFSLANPAELEALATQLNITI
jgi:TusA-related sulfurtransferase